MKAQLEAIRGTALEAIHAAGNAAELDAVRVQYLGKKGELTAVLKQMGKLSAEERPIMGQAANAVRAVLEEKLEARKTELDAAALDVLPYVLLNLIVYALWQLGIRRRIRLHDHGE